MVGLLVFLAGGATIVFTKLIPVHLRSRLQALYGGSATMMIMLVLAALILPAPSVNLQACLRKRGSRRKKFRNPQLDWTNQGLTMYQVLQQMHQQRLDCPQSLRKHQHRQISAMIPYHQMLLLFLVLVK